MSRRSRRRRAQTRERAKRRPGSPAGRRRRGREALSRPDSGPPAPATPARGEAPAGGYAALASSSDPATSTATGPGGSTLYLAATGEEIYTHPLVGLPLLRPGDQLYVRREIAGPVGDWIVGFLIRVLTFTKRDKRPTVVNHVATVIRAVLEDLHDGLGERVIDYVIAEALGKGGFQYRRLLDAYGDDRLYSVAVARNKLATDAQRAAIVAACAHLIGKKYGYLKIGAHVGDYGLTQIWNALGGRSDVYLFRWLCGMKRYPMCSWASLYAYAKAGLPFDVPVRVGSPDDMWDECLQKTPMTWWWPFAYPSLARVLGPSYQLPRPAGEVAGREFGLRCIRALYPPEKGGEPNE